MLYFRWLFALLLAVPSARADLTNSTAGSITNRYVGEAWLPDEVDGEAGLPYENTKPQQQADCGSCWAFSTTEQLSARILKQPGAWLDEEGGNILAPQPLLTFGHSFNRKLGACNGGFPYLAAEYMQEKGIPTPDCAPYLSGSCSENNPKDDVNSDGCTSGRSYTEGTCWGDRAEWLQFGLYKQAFIADVKYVTGEKDMMADIAQHGPLTAIFDVFKEIYDYKGGIFIRGTPDEGGHAILVSGYANSDDGTPYWRIRNSWGEDWGERGYVRFIRGRNFANLEHYSTTSIIIGSEASGSIKSTSRQLPHHTPSEKFKPGAWVDRDVMDDVVLEAKDALQKHLNTSSIHVVSARSQVVQGIQVHLIVGTPSGRLSAVAHRHPTYSGTIGVPAHQIVKIASVPDAQFFV